MERPFLNIPIKFSDLTQKKDHARIDVKKSIHNMISLITTTSYGEVKSDPGFGCEIWEHDFENIYNTQMFKEELIESIKQSISKNEKRLKNVSVDLQLEQVEVKVANRRVKTRIKLEVNGLIDKTNEKILHQEMFFIGPLSYY